MRARSILIWLSLLTVMYGCSDAPKLTEHEGPLHDLHVEAPCAAPDLALNEVQSIGSHNSYKTAIPRLEMMALRRNSAEAADALDYSHLSLSAQLDLGMRQLEIDVFYDPEGGLYSDPYLPRAIPSIGKRYNEPEMDKPGFKVMHVQDVDQRSHCQLFTQCLSQISAWSNRHPQHTPILILVNAKQAPIELEQAVVPLAFTGEAFDALDAELRSAIAPSQLITPDDIRAGAPTLRGAVTRTGWPSYQTSKGKLLFALDEPFEVVNTYLRGKLSLEGHPFFVNSVSQDSDHAAYFTLNDPRADALKIRMAVDAGFLVRTRADADTFEARTNDTARRSAAFASGAQYISTDYYLPRKEWSDYAVRLPEGSVTRCRP